MSRGCCAKVNEPSKSVNIAPIECLSYEARSLEAKCAHLECARHVRVGARLNARSERAARAGGWEGGGDP
jgi:hypothetical protein